MCVCVKAFWHFAPRQTAALSGGKIRPNSSASILTSQLDCPDNCDAPAYAQMRDYGWVQFRWKESKHADGTCLRREQTRLALSAQRSALLIIDTFVPFTGRKFASRKWNVPKQKIDPKINGNVPPYCAVICGFPRFLGVFCTQLLSRSNVT